jgi:hypothetical protein
VTDENLLAELKQAASPPPPPNFRPGVTFQGRSPSEIVTPPLPAMDTVPEFEAAVRALGYPLPEGMTLVLVEMQMAQHENFWQRDPVTVEGHTEGVGDAYTAPSSSWRYRFKVVPKSARADEDIAVLMAEAKAAPPSPNRYPARGAHGTTTRVINLSDFQWGKVDELGGTLETLARSEAALAIVLKSLEDNPVDEIVLVDPGDILEGTESAPNALGTNDLSTTEQVRIARRVFWRWIEALAPHAARFKVVGVPSNHCRVRRGKAALGDALDDWGIEIIAQLADIAAVNPEAYGHIEFIVPEAHQEHVLLPLVGGKVLGVAHGHQKGSPAALAGWVKSTGRRGLQQADIVVVGHFHHLVVEAFGDEQWLFICPTNDNGSSWFTPSSGERSEPGVLTFSVDARGWFALDPVWLGNVA